MLVALLIAVLGALIVASVKGTIATIVLAVAVSSVLGVQLGVWTAMTRVARRRLGSGIHGLMKEGESSAALRRCDAVARDLAKLLEPLMEDEWQDLGHIERRRAARDLVRSYRREHRTDALRAIALVGAVHSVPPAVIRSAREPRSVDDIRYVRDWLRYIAEDKTLA